MTITVNGRSDKYKLVCENFCCLENATRYVRSYKGVQAKKDITMLYCKLSKFQKQNFGIMSDFKAKGNKKEIRGRPGHGRMTYT